MLIVINSLFSKLTKFNISIKSINNIFMIVKINNYKLSLTWYYLIKLILF